jgi:prephenate dehydrogenase (NADP+)
MYAVEAEHIDRVVAQYGPATKIGSIVSGQTSVKQPEIEAFERHLPSDVHIISCHSMHGPNVNPKGQPLVMIKHRASQEKFDMVRNILSGFESNMVELSYQDHDRITADTQAVTHAAFLSMGAAWKANNQFPVSFDDIFTFGPFNRQPWASLTALITLSVVDSSFCWRYRKCQG